MVRVAIFQENAPKPRRAVWDNVEEEHASTAASLAICPENAPKAEDLVTEPVDMTVHISQMNNF